MLVNMIMGIIEEEIEILLKVVLLFFFIFACRADERTYHYSKSSNNADAVGGANGEELRVGFENTPRMKDNRVNINIGVTSKNSAVEYKYALISGDAAKEGSSACGSAEYGDFVPLAQTISHSGLPEGHHLICARGKNAAGLTQQSPSTLSWVIDTSITIEEEEEVEQPDEEELPDNPSVDNTQTVEPIEDEKVEEKPSPMPTSAPEPDPEPAPNPEPTLRLAAINISTKMLKFSNSERRKISVYVHNEGTAPLNWRMQSDSSTEVKWLRAEYDSKQVEQIPDDSENAIFSGTVAAGSKSEAIDFSLKLNAKTGKVLDEYLEYRDPKRYSTTLVFYDEDNSTSVELTVYLYIPNLSLSNSRPRTVNGNKRYGQLSLPKDEIGSIYRVYINKRGQGSLSWRALRSTGSGADKRWFAIPINSSWTKLSDNSRDNWFAIRTRKTFIEIKLNNTAKQKKLTHFNEGSGGKNGWYGSWNWIIFSSNGGRSYSGQKVAGRRYFKVCFEEKAGEHKNECGN